MRVLKFSFKITSNNWCLNLGYSIGVPTTDNRRLLVSMLYPKEGRQTRVTRCLFCRECEHYSVLVLKSNATDETTGTWDLSRVTGMWHYISDYTDLKFRLALQLLGVPLSARHATWSSRPLLSSLSYTAWLQPHCWVWTYRSVGFSPRYFQPGSPSVCLYPLLVKHNIKKI